MNKVDIKFGFLCNNMCLFCVQGDKREKLGDISFNDLVKTLQSAREKSDNVVFTGGEVTIKKEFLKLLKVADDLGFKKIQVQTNGRMFANEGFCDDTILAGATEFSLALHGHTPELHDYLTSVDGSFYQTVKGIKNLKKRNQYVGTNSVITRPNYRFLPELAQLLIHLNVNQYQFAFVHAVGNAGKNFDSIVPRYSMIEPFVKNALSFGVKAGITVMTEAIPYCFMTGFSDFIAERIIPDTVIFDKDMIIDDYTKYRKNEGKLKGEPCDECACSTVCEGPWREYPEKYGWYEFKPIK
jgi:MoaA/NifB/PqqE/SkfB family radical SAM enzyme